MIFEQIAGAAIVVIFLADIFLTVLYARVRTSLLARPMNHLLWRLIKVVSGWFGRGSAKVLSFGGPIIVVLLIFTWSLGLTLGAALIMQPLLGDSVRPSSGPASRDFITAWFVGASSMSFVSASDYSPHTAASRLLFMFNALAGASALSLTISYLVQVYSALRERNALTLTVDMMTDCTGDAARALARLGSDGKFQSGYSELSNVASSLSALKEAHHFYPLLFYFRFEDARYSVSRLCFVILDLVTLIGTALDEEKLKWLERSSAVARLRHGGELMLKMLEQGLPRHAAATGLQTVRSEALQEHYRACCRELAAAGLSLNPSAAATYASQRLGWEPRLLRVASILGYSREDVIGDRRSATHKANGR